jgi:hypothetical protein
VKPLRTLVVLLVLVLALVGWAATAVAADPVAPVAQTGASRSFTVLAITVTNPGSGFTSAPTVTIASNTGRDLRASVKATLSGGTVASVTLTHGGAGCSPSSPPTVSFSGGGGCPAATAAVSGGAVTSVTVKPGEGGSGYTSAPTVVFVGEGTGAAAIATVSGGTVTGITVTKPGSGYKSAPAVSFYGGAGGVAATAEVVTPHDDYYWATQGIGVPLPSPRFTNNHDGTLTDHRTGLIWLANANAFGSVPWAQALADCAGLASGSYGLTDGSKAGDWRLPNFNELRSLCNYGQSPVVSNDQGNAFWGASFQGERNYWSATTYLGKPGYAWAVSLTYGCVSYTVSHGDPHFNYVLPVRGQGTNGVAPVAQTGAKESFTALGVTVTNPGSGYTSASKVTISAPVAPGTPGRPVAGTTAVAKSTFGGVSSITIVSGGSGYTSVPAVTFAGGTGGGAAAYATLTGGVVTHITITEGGSYKVAPQVTIAPPIAPGNPKTPAAGVTATATAALSGDTVGAIIVTYGGSGYSPAAPPTVSFSGGGGSGAAATAAVITDHDDAYWAKQGVGVPSPTPRFTNNHNGTVTDNKTGLIWLANANAFGRTTQAQALAACSNLASGSYGLTDGSTAGQWRLPNVEELQTLCNYGYSQPAFTNDQGDAQWTPGSVGTTCSFADVQSGYYWSSTFLNWSPDSPWTVDLGHGTVHFEYPGGNPFVWPVRGGK